MIANMNMNNKSRSERAQYPTNTASLLKDGNVESSFKCSSKYDGYSAARNYVTPDGKTKPIPGSTYSCGCPGGVGWQYCCECDRSTVANSLELKHKNSSTTIDSSELEHGNGVHSDILHHAHALNGNGDGGRRGSLLDQIK